VTKSDDHFEEFEPHTRLKHLIFEAYLKVWVRKMLLRKGGGRRVIFIDACAGTGHDEMGNSGSPVIAAREAAIAAEQVSEMQGYPVQVLTIAIEKKAAHFRELVGVLAPFGDNARAIEGELVDHLDALLDEAGTDPVLCFVDPFGVKPLRASIIRAILDRPHGEVFVLFADQACLRHFGAASAAEAAAAPPMPDLFSALDDAVPSIKGEATKSSEALALTGKNAEEILDAAFGGLPWRERIAAVPQSARRAEFVALYKEFLRDCDAPYVLPIPMRNTENQHVYYLIHASRSVHGYVTMKEAVSSALGRSQLGEHATNTMRFAIRSNLPAVVRDILTRFTGRTVPWTTAGPEGGPLRDYVLQQTPVFPHEVPALHELLKAYRVPGVRSIVYQFPGEQLAAAPGARPLRDA
jgi:three-Cys-motif partner protein